MREVFRFVEPRAENLHVFGHEIRQLLVLACNEVEAQCKAVLRANGYAPRAANGGLRRLTMRDYFRVSQPLRLDEWRVTLAVYPLPPISPFAEWVGNFVQLPWYGAYNAVKHDREIAFHEATLANLIDAMSAVCVLVVAQFGHFGRVTIAGRDPTEDFDYTAPPFALDEHYLPPHLEPGAVFTPINYPF
jgi:hypothetical protein